MKTFSEYYEEKENEQMDEAVAETIVAGAYALPITLALGYFAFNLIYRYAKFNWKIVMKIVKTWEDFKNLFKRSDKEKTKKKIKKTMDTISESPEAQKANRQVDKLKSKYADILKELFEAIEANDQERAKNAFLGLESKYQNNPEVNTAILGKILDTYKEPPIHTSSPGNETYQMIKKILGQKVAKATEEMTREGFEKYYEKANEEEV